MNRREAIKAAGIIIAGLGVSNLLAADTLEEEVKFTTVSKKIPVSELKDGEGGYIETYIISSPDKTLYLLHPSQKANRETQKVYCIPANVSSKHENGSWKFYIEIPLSSKRTFIGRHGNNYYVSLPEVEDDKELLFYEKFWDFFNGAAPITTKNMYPLIEKKWDYFVVPIDCNACNKYPIITKTDEESCKERIDGETFQEWLKRDKDASFGNVETYDEIIKMMDMVYSK